MDKGHLLQEQKNLRSTKKPITPSVIPSVMTAPYPIPGDVGVQANMIFNKILPIRVNTYSDQTGQLPVVPSWCEKYIMAMAYYGSDAIL